MSVRLQIAPGDGLVLRRATALLFLPDASAGDGLVAAFTGAGDGDVLEAVTLYADERELDVPEFAAVEWAGKVRLAVFGNVAVTSDHRSLPRLSAAGSATWVERTLRADAVRLTAGSDAVHPASDVQLGAVPAGGFALALGRIADSSPPAAAPDAAADAAPPDETPAVAPAEAPPVAPSEAPLEPPPTAPGEPAEADQLACDPPSEPAATDEPPPAPPAPAASGRDDPTIDAPDHFPVGATGRWALRFEDGRLEHVDAALVIGRQPDADRIPATAGAAPARTIQIDCAQMSASHLGVWADTVGLWVADLNSRNRSWVVTSGDHRLVALEPDEPTRLEHGTHVQIGTKVFVVERGGDE